MSGARIEEEGKTQLLNNQGKDLAFGQNDDQLAGNDFGDGYNDFDIRPSSSRVKKVLIWNTKRREFDMSEQDKDDLRAYHIKDPGQW